MCLAEYLKTGINKTKATAPPNDSKGKKDLGVCYPLPLILRVTR